MTIPKRLKAKRRRKDYEKKRNILRNNVPHSKYRHLEAGDGILPMSKKYRD